MSINGINQDATTPELFSTKQVLASTLLTGPLSGCLLIALNYEARKNRKAYLGTLFLSALVTLMFFMVIYHVEDITITETFSISVFWPIIMAFIIAVAAELIHGEYYDQQTELNAIKECSVKRTILFSVIGLFSEFILLLVIFMFSSING